MHAAGKIGRLICVAGITLHLGDLVRVRIALDIGVAGIAAQAAVDALAERIAVHADVVAGGILEPLVGVARQAVRLGSKPARKHGNQQQNNAAGPKRKGYPIPRSLASPINCA